MQIIRCLPPVRWMLLETAHDCGCERWRKLGAVVCYRSRCSRYVSGKSLLLIEPTERWPTREQLVSHYTERVDVGTRVDVRICRRLFRRHIGWSAESDS